ncbi:MAG: hypothetical protein NTZ12_10215 [Candidatus Aminicenantes bacterium]|nr:hypothetical protein [Candidatus Aminicenantes bacterium]
MLSGEKVKVKNTEADVITKIKAARQGYYEEKRDSEEAPENDKPGIKFTRR